VKYLPAMLLAIGVVILMAGPGQKKVRAGESIILVIIGAIIMAVIFGLVVSRTLNG
jgi:hypothetical protein